jgi:HlyD family secretion protein
VDAFPEREFEGTVEQVRLNPTTVSNVVSYNTIVSVDNRDLLLRPGMTATVSIVVRKAENALRLPASALRFRPEGYQRPSGARGRPVAATAGDGQATARAGGGRPGSPGGRAPGAVRAGGSPGPPWPAARGTGGREAGARPTTVFVPDEKGQPKAVDVRIGSPTGSSWRCARASRRAPP